MALHASTAAWAADSVVMHVTPRITAAERSCLVRTRPAAARRVDDQGDLAFIMSEQVRPAFLNFGTSSTGMPTPRSTRQCRASRGS